MAARAGRRPGRRLERRRRSRSRASACPEPRASAPTTCWPSTSRPPRATPTSSSSRRARGTLSDPRTRARIDARAEEGRRRTARSPASRARSPPGGQLTKDGRIGVANADLQEEHERHQARRRWRRSRTRPSRRAARSCRSSTAAPAPRSCASTNSQGPSEFFGIIAAAIVLLITFGSLVAAGLPLIATLLALGTTLGVITLISHLVDTPDFATQLASLIGLGVGIDYSLFVVTRYRAEVRQRPRSRRRRSRWRSTRPGGR